MTPKQHKDMAAVATEFLYRVRLEGREVPAFNSVMAWLAGFSVAQQDPKELWDEIAKRVEEGREKAEKAEKAEDAA